MCTEWWKPAPQMKKRLSYVFVDVLQVFVQDLWNPTVQDVLQAFVQDLWKC